jgi:hypothetical protein
VPTVQALRVLVASVASLAAVPQLEPKTGIVEMRTMFVTTAGHGETSEVTYAIASVPPDAIGAEVQIRRDAQIVARYPVPLVAGTAKVQIPAGLPIDFPSPDLLIELETSPDTFTPIDEIRIDTPEQAARTRAIAAMDVDTVRPDLVEQGSGPLTVTLGGARLTTVASFAVGHVELRPTVVDGVMKLELPADLLDEPGFLSVRAPKRDDPPSAAIAVADRSLAHAGLLTGPRIASAAVRWDERTGSTWLTVTGAGFEPGMRLAIGRGRRLIARLETEVSSASAMDGKIAWRDAGSHPDFFLAVVSADGATATRPFPIASPDALLAAYFRDVPAPSLRGPDAYVVHGTLLWNRLEPQGFHLEGRLARPGVRVRLSRDEGGDDRAIVVTEAASPGAAGATRPVVYVPVPASLTMRPEYTVALAILSK